MTQSNGKISAFSTRVLKGCLAGLAGVVVLAAAATAGRALQRDAVAGAKSPQAFDSMRQVLFVADACCGTVRVLHLRNNIGELAVLRTPGRMQVHDLALDPTRRWLWVLGDKAVERYDALSLKPAGSFPLVAGQSLQFARVERDSYVLRAAPLKTTPKV